MHVVHYWVKMRIIISYRCLDDDCVLDVRDTFTCKPEFYLAAFAFSTASVIAFMAFPLS